MEEVSGTGPLTAAHAAEISDAAHESQQTSMAEPASTELQSVGRAWPRLLTGLRHHDFRYMWAGNFLSNIGTWMQNVAQGWLVLQLTNSPFWLGLLSFASAVPMLLFTLVGGVIADNVDKKKMLIRCQIGMMFVAFLLAILSFTHRITAEQIIVLAFITGIASSLAAPSHQALVPQLVPRDELPNAIGLNSAQFNMSRVLGPTLGGFAMAWFTISGNFLLNGLSFLAVIFALTRLRSSGQSVPTPGSWWARLVGGFQYVFGTEKTSVLVVLVSVGGLLGMPYFAFVPYFARDILHVDERGLGVLMAFSGLGAFFGAVTMAYLGKQRGRGRFVFFAGLGFLFSVICFSLSRWFLLSALLQMLAGFSLILMVATINTRLQLLASDVMRGRAMSIYATAYLGLPPIGSFIAAWLSRWTTPARAIAAMSALGVACFITIFAASPELRSLD